MPRFSFTDALPTITNGVIDVVHRNTGPQDNPDRAISVVVRAAKVFTSIQRALTMAQTFIDTDGRSTMRKAGDYAMGE